MPGSSEPGGNVGMANAQYILDAMTQLTQGITQSIDQIHHSLGKLQDNYQTVSQSVGEFRAELNTMRHEFENRSRYSYSTSRTNEWVDNQNHDLIEAGESVSRTGDRTIPNPVHVHSNTVPQNQDVARTVEVPLNADRSPEHLNVDAGRSLEISHDHINGSTGLPHDNMDRSRDRSPDHMDRSRDRPNDYPDRSNERPNDYTERSHDRPHDYANRSHDRPHDCTGRSPDRPYDHTYASNTHSNNSVPLTLSTMTAPVVTTTVPPFTMPDVRFPPPHVFRHPLPHTHVVPPNPNGYNVQNGAGVAGFTVTGNRYSHTTNVRPSYSEPNPNFHNMRNSAGATGYTVADTMNSRATNTREPYTSLLYTSPSPRDARKYSV